MTDNLYESRVKDALQKASSSLREVIGEEVELVIFAAVGDRIVPVGHGSNGFLAHVAIGTIVNLPLPDRQLVFDHFDTKSGELIEYPDG